MSRYRFTPPYLLIFLIFLFIFSLPIKAATFTVANLNDSGPGSLRQAVLDANASLTSTHTIEFQPGLTGTITLTSGEIVITGRITINGPGADVLAVSRSGTGMRLFNASSQEAAINGLTVTNGYKPDCWGCGTEDNGLGGGIYNSGFLTLSNMILSRNSAGNAGGGVWNSGILTVSNSILSDNNSQSGGGIGNSGTLIVSNSMLSNNRAGYSGGGISNGYSGTLTVSNSTLFGNSIYYRDSAVNIPDGAVGGGGISNFGTLNLSNSTLSNNQVRIIEINTFNYYYAKGGAIYNLGNLTVLHSTLIRNFAVEYNGNDASGGGIYSDTIQPVTVANSIVLGNHNFTSNSVYLSEIMIVGSTANLQNNLSYWSGTIGTMGSVINTSLTDNGGPTQTHALVAGSPAINAGNNSLIPAGVTTDQRGEGFPRIIGGTVDIGAVESNIDASHVLTVTKGGSGTGTVISDPTGIDCGVDCSEGYPANTVVTLTATPYNPYPVKPLSTGTRHLFAGWSGACTGVSTTCTVTMDAAKHVTATFNTPSTYALTLTTAGTGSGTVGGAGNYSAGTMVMLTATPNAGSIFAGWSPSPCASSFAMPTNDLTCTATFTLKSYTVTATARSGGSISPTSRTVNHGATTTFTVTPNSGYRAAVTDCGGTLSGSTYTTGPITGDCTVNASFTTNSYALTVNKAGTGSGTVISNPAGINCGSDCTESYGSSTSVTLTATPASGSTFAGWSGACSGTGSCTVTMNAAKSVSATFNQSATSTYVLTVRSTGTGNGTVSGAGNYAAGATVNLTATPSAGSTFAGWSPNPCAASFSMPATHLTCTATFTIVDPIPTTDPATTLINHYYVSILERAPEADGLAFWQGLVADKEARGEDVKDVFRQMADFFFNSPEYIGRNTTDRQFITNLYLTFFQREPDEGGYAFWLDQLAKGMTRNDAMRGFLYSPEFTAFMEEVLGSTVVTELYPRIDFVSDQMLLFNDIGQSANLQVRVLDAAGQEISNAQVIWSSSAPGTVAITPTSGLSAKVDALANWSSSITLTATYAPLNLSAQAQAVMAVLAPNAVLASSNQVLDISGDRTGVHQVILTRTAQTEALQVGQMIVTGDQAGVMVRILGVTLESSRVILSVEPALITEVFKGLDISTQSQPMRLHIQASQGNTTMTLRSLPDQAILSQQVLPASFLNLKDWKCQGGLDLISGELKITDIDLIWDITTRTALKVENWKLLNLLLLFEGQAGITANLNLKLAAGVTVSGQCSYKPKQRIRTVAMQWGPINILPVVVLSELGIKASYSNKGSLERALTLGRIWQITGIGIRYTDVNGWQKIADYSVQDMTEKGSLEFTASQQIKIESFANYDLNLDFGLGAWKFIRNLASIKFFGLATSLYYQAGIDEPVDSTLKEYLGPTVEMGVKAEGKVTLQDGDVDQNPVPESLLAEYLPVQFPKFEFVVLSEQIVLYQTPKPTGSVVCNPSCDNVDNFSNVTLTATSTDTTATGLVEFWASRDGASQLSRLKMAPFTGGRGEATYSPDSSTEPGRYTIYPRLWLDSGVSPLASAQPIGAFSIGGGCVEEGQIIQVNGVDRYKVVGSDCSIVADLVTGLEWQRCNLGSDWNASTQSCDGRPLAVTWHQAMTQTAPGGFRLPTIEELRSLVYCSNTGVIGMNADFRACGIRGTYQFPTIVLEAFLFRTISSWSSSPYGSSDAWKVDFGTGEVHHYSKNNSSFVLLVRGGQSLAFLPSTLATRQDPLLSPKAAPVLLSSELPPTLRSLISDAQAPLSSPQASVDGRVIVFATEAALLPEDNNGVSDIYHFTLAKGQLQRLSLGWDGQPANGASHSPRLDASGQRVVFLSAATNLTLGLPGTADQIYLHDEQISGLLRLSETPTGEPADAAITHPLIDAAGEQVVYRSAAHNLGDGPGLYQHDLLTGRRQPIALDEQGQPDPHADAPAADAMLAFIAYQRSVSEGPVADAFQVYLDDQTRNLTERISPLFNEYGQPVTGCCVSVSPDGAYLAWRETTADGERRLVLMERASERRSTQPWPQAEALAEQAPVFRNENRELWWVAPLQGPGSEPVLQRMQNPLMEAGR